MVNPASMVVALKTLMIIMYCAIIAAFAYVFVIGAILPCYTWTLRWDALLLVDYTVFCFIFGAWFYYKESSWIKTTIFFLGMEIAGSVVTIPYIYYQFMKLSSEELSKDPIYFVLVRNKKREQENTKGTSVATARVIFTALGVLLLGVFIYTIIWDIVRFYAEPITPCLLTYMVDIYIHTVLLSVWITYKESSWISAFLWILLLVFSGTIATIVYILWEVFSLSPDQPASYIIFNSKDRDLQSSDPLLV